MASVSQSDKEIAVGVGLVDGPHGHDVAKVYSDDCDLEEAVANAKLIAAAPDLLAVCEALLFAIEQDKVRGLGRCIDVARAAIAKATS
jgi:hypothetical protein